MAGREETVDDRTIFEFISDHEDPVVTTSEVANFLDFSNPGTLKRLHSLEEEGLLHSKEAGRSKVWWTTQRGDELLKKE